MGSTEKLWAKIRRHPLPCDITMNELDRFLRSKGFILHSRSSSHLNYKHKNLDYILTIVAHDFRDQVKPVYIKNVVIALDELEK